MNKERVYIENIDTEVYENEVVEEQILDIATDLVAAFCSNPSIDMENEFIQKIDLAIRMAKIIINK